MRNKTRWSCTRVGCILLVLVPSLEQHTFSLIFFSTLLFSLSDIYTRKNSATRFVVCFVNSILRTFLFFLCNQTHFLPLHHFFFYFSRKKNEFFGRLKLSIFSQLSTRFLYSVWPFNFPEKSLYFKNEHKFSPEIFCHIRTYVKNGKTWFFIVQLLRTWFRCGENSAHCQHTRTMKI